MPLQPEDIYRLQIWSFIKDFQSRKAEFIDLARIAYHSTKVLAGARPTPDDCERLFSGVLLGAPIFGGVLARKRFLRPIFYPAYSLAFARYVLHNHWREISV